MSDMRRAQKPSLPRSLPRAARAKVEAAVEAHTDARDALVAFLDEADGDPDLQPSLAATEIGGRWPDDRGGFSAPSAIESLDLEEVCEDEGAQSDDEGGDLDIGGRGYL